MRVRAILDEVRKVVLEKLVALFFGVLHNVVKYTNLAHQYIELPSDGNDVNSKPQKSAYNELTLSARAIRHNCGHSELMKLLVGLQEMIGVFASKNVHHLSQNKGVSKHIT